MDSMKSLVVVASSSSFGRFRSTDRRQARFAACLKCPRVASPINLVAVLAVDCCHSRWPLVENVLQRDFPRRLP